MLSRSVQCEAKNDPVLFFHKFPKFVLFHELVITKMKQNVPISVFCFIENHVEIKTSDDRDIYNMNTFSVVIHMALKISKKIPVSRTRVC